jgi:hypothetical protein
VIGAAIGETVARPPSLATDERCKEMTGELIVEPRK